MPDDRPIPAEPIAVPEPAQAQASPEASDQLSEILPHEEPPAMLDIHPAHHAASTWRDFFIHIATIVLGLLIAIGLEQASSTSTTVAKSRKPVKPSASNEKKTGKPSQPACPSSTARPRP